MKRKDTDKWIEAVDSELSSIIDNNVFEICNLSIGRKTIKPRWIFDLRRNGNGDVVRYKARLVAKGYTQIKGVDHEKVFAPVIKLTTIRFLLALAAHRNYEIEQVDIKTAFLNSELNEDIYLEPPNIPKELHKKCRASS